MSDLSPERLRELAAWHDAMIRAGSINMLVQADTAAALRAALRLVQELEDVEVRIAAHEGWQQTIRAILDRAKEAP